jgi:ATP-dependent helicase/nuclease subunit A
MMGHMDGPQMHVAEKDPATGVLQLRPLRWRDIVVLLRSMKFKSDSFTRILSQHRIPTHRDSGSGFFDSMEVRDILSLLQLLDNQCQDIPLAAVLRSPLSGPAASDDDLARIVLAFAKSNEPVPFHLAVWRYADSEHDDLAQRLGGFREILGQWRRVAQTRPPADLIWRIYNQTGYLAWCSGLENGEQRAANLVGLHERARQFGQFSRQS